MRRRRADTSAEIPLPPREGGPERAKRVEGPGEGRGINRSAAHGAVIPLGMTVLLALLLGAPLIAQCTEGAVGNATPQSFAPLTGTEVDAIVHAAATSLNVNNLTIAVVDRAGRPLAVFAQSGAPASDADRAVGVARAAAFFSHNMAPLSSRTVRFISGIHFPPGVTNAGNAALYGIENTNRGCTLSAAVEASGFSAWRGIERELAVTGTVSGEKIVFDPGEGDIRAHAFAKALDLFKKPLRKNDHAIGDD